MKHTVVISDVHLCEAVDGDGLWMRYRQRRFFPDAELAELCDLACAQARGQSLELVFNGDLFDFDAPEAAGPGEVHFDDPPRNADVAVAVLARILRDHEAFVAALGRVLAEGHTIVFVSGNHDAQLCFPGVRALIADRIAVAAREAGASAEPAALRSRVLFRAWFHRTTDGIHIEHGNQYDRYCSFRSPVEPFTPDGTAIQPTMGSLSFRHLVARMGYFNPHVDASFMLSLPGYLAHWGRYYLHTNRSLAAAWAKGAVRIVAEVLRHRHPRDAALFVRAVARTAAETGAAPDAIARHASLFAPPTDEVPHAVMRELWLDRAALGAAAGAAILVAAAAGPVAAAKLALGAVGTIAAYELAMPKPSLDETYVHVAHCAREIARIHRARAVVLGHTHQPYGRWEDGVFQGNCGTWSAAFHDVECTRPVDDGRPVVWLRTHPGGRMEGGLYTFRRHQLLEHPESAKERAVASAPDGAVIGEIALGV